MPPEDDSRRPPEDPAAPPSGEELRAAAALRDELEEGHGPAVTWLRAHLRLPIWEDSLGEVRARGLARAAREQVQARRAAQTSLLPARLPPWRQLRRALLGTGGLIAVAVLLLNFSSVIMDQAGRPAEAEVQRAWRAQLLRASLQRRESPSRRLELLIQERLQAWRWGSHRSRGQLHLGLASGEVP